MRAGRIILSVIAAVLLVGTALALTGNLPPAVKDWSTLASAWTASSSDAGPLVDGGVDAAVKAQAAGLSSAQLSAPLYHVPFISACGAPADMRVVIKAAVKMGRAVDVQVTTDPPDPAIELCIEAAIRDLRWDPSRKTDHLTVRY
jgi:hypothetical protein